jgi:hypothetical protein
MQVDQTYCNVLIGENSALPANQFTWVDYGTSTTSKINLSLTAGGHTIVLAGVDPGVGVDKLMLLSDATCVPTGFGANCSPAATPTPVPVGGVTPQPPATSTPKPTTSTTPTPVVIKPGNSTTPVAVSGVITLTPQTPTTNSVKFLVDGQPVAGDQLDTTKLSDGEHVIKQVTTDSSGKSTTTQQTIKVENGWQYQLVRGIQGHWQIIASIVLLLIILGGGIVYALTRHIFGAGKESSLYDGITVSAVPNTTISTSTLPSDNPTVLPDTGTPAAALPSLTELFIAPSDPPASVDSPPPNKS